MATETFPWDPADHLKNEEDIIGYLEAAFEDGDPQVISMALGDIARARGMSKVALDAKVNRQSLYKALGPDGNPTLATFLGVMKSLGLKIHAAAA